MKKATFLVPHFRPSGGIRHILEYANALARSGWNVRVRCVGVYGNQKKDPHRPDQLKEWWSAYDPNLVRYEVGTMRGTADVRLVNRSRLERVHGFVTEPGEVVVTYGDAENEQFNGSHLRETVNVLLVMDWLAFAPARQLSYLTQGTWDAVACSTQWLAKQVREATSLDPWVVGAGVDLESFFPSHPPKDSVPTIGTMHGANPAKGWDEAVSIAKRTAKLLGRRVRLLTFGADELRERSPAPMEVDVVHVRRPDVSTMRDMYSAADVWLCASHTEGFGLPSLEAMACGTPVVTFDNGGWSYAQVDGETSFVVPLLDVAAAATRCAEILGDESLRDRMAVAAHRRAQACSWDHSVALFEGMLDNVLASLGRS